MENTIENAKEFLTKWRDERTHPVSTDYFAELIVAYAASVRPELKLPSNDWLQDFSEGELAVALLTIGKIKYLNLGLNFVESK